MTTQPQNNPQPGGQAEQEELRTARLYMRWLLTSDTHTDLLPGVGRWDEAFQAIHAAHKIGGRAAARKAFNTLCKNDPSLMIVVSGEEKIMPSPVSKTPPGADASTPADATETVEPLPVSNALTDIEPLVIESSINEPLVNELSAIEPSVSEIREVVEASTPARPTSVGDDVQDTAATSLSFKPLPVEVRLPEELGVAASPWLDAYITFSRKWSPRGYEDFHEAVALWVLSTVAARRVMLPLGDKYYTPMLIVLVGRTGLYAKSTTAKIGRAVLKSADLEWFLAADDATPQKFISEMAGHFTENYNDMPLSKKKEFELQLVFSGQRGWFYDEFGQIMASIMKDGIMSDFRGILRRLDDCYDRYKYATISRGVDIVENPYLALLGSMTPSDLGKAAKSGSSLWGDGFLARFAFVTPPAGSSGSGRFPEGLRVIPEELWSPLRMWHERLGIPDLIITPLVDKKGNPTGEHTFERGKLPEQYCKAGKGVMDAYYAYSEALVALRAATNKQNDLDGNYNRFASKALRIAMLLASLENDGKIEMCHWARGQAISERWRASVHELLAQANEAPADESEMMEEKILQVVEKLKQASVREIKQYIRGIDAVKLRVKVQELAQVGMLEAVNCEKSVRYRLPRSTTTRSG